MSLIEKAAKHLATLPSERKPALPANSNAASSSSVNPNNPVPTGQMFVSQKIDIDLRRLEKQGFVIPGNSKAPVGEEFRIVKRPLLANIAGHSDTPIRNANLIMVTSALPKEGKTFTAFNLAVSIAMELDRTVLLVDADVAKPSLPSLLDLPPRRGLLDVLQPSSCELSEVLLRTNIEKLNLLFAGGPHSHATELLASQAMIQLLDEMAQRYSDRIIIFDSPPLLLSTEARVLASHMGQIVFVVRAEETLQSAVKEALTTIESCPVKFMVLNQARSVDPITYGYGYGS